MAITRGSSIAKGEEAIPLPSHNSNSNQEQPQSTEKTQSVSEYEQFRKQRIRENRERLQKLGIVDLSLKLKSTAPPRRIPRSLSDRKPPLKSPPSAPIRRSSRLQNVTPVSYTQQLKEEKPLRRKDIVIEEGAKPEVYTEEHEKLLGSTKMIWTLFVDGCRPDGGRIYDPVNGKTCHQCRQKTLGLRTRCCKCNLVQGQFCGDCLYMRYGEHVVEANQNRKWICPPCRGICNCSLCRQARGWPPTGALYRKITSLGFKSVAHYLITTKRASDDCANNTPQSGKRSLPFKEMEASVDDKALNFDGNGNKATSVNELNLEEEGVFEDKAASVRRVGRKSKKEIVDNRKELVGMNNSNCITDSNSIARRLTSRRRT